MSQEGKVAFITGGLGGIGLSFGENLLQQGAKVALIDIKDGGEEVKKKYGKDRVMVLKCDITDVQQLRGFNLRRVFLNVNYVAYQEVVDSFGGLDLVINSAGIIDEINYERTIDVNLTSIISSSYMAVERMRKDKGGRGGTLINIASAAALFVIRYELTYSATKAALITFDKALAANLGDNKDTQVKVGTICPGTVDTEFPVQLRNRNFRESDITQPRAEENLDDLLTNDIDVSQRMSPERVSDVMMKYLADPDLHGSVIIIMHDYVEYVYPDSLKGKKIVTEQK